jgi:hypothetical protein
LEKGPSGGNAQNPHVKWRTSTDLQRPNRTEKMSRKAQTSWWELVGIGRYMCMHLNVYMKCMRDHLYALVLLHSVHIWCLHR